MKQQPFHPLEIAPVVAHQGEPFAATPKKAPPQGRLELKAKGW
jgi:hypothetical protein